MTLGKTLIGIGLTLILLSLITLPFETSSSGVFIVNIMALIISVIFLVLVIVLIIKRIII